MTEEEAKTKWCPLFGIGAAITASYPEKPALELQNEFKRCKGSACMMWRRSHPDLEGVGYCGLAGKP